MVVWAFSSFCAQVKFYGGLRIRILKLNLFGVLKSIDIVISVKSLLTETMISIDTRMPNGLSLDL